MASANRKSNLAVVLISDIPGEPTPDDQGTLEQAGQVADALHKNGFETETFSFMRDIGALRERLTKLQPAVVFNLVETIFDRAGMVHLAPALLEEMNLPFTGSGSSGMYMSMNKIVSKRVMRGDGISTPDWCEAPDWHGLDENRRYIVKCATEHASIGLTADSIVTGRDAVIARVREVCREWPADWYAESFVEGREFNIAMLDGNEGGKIMPLAEMTFDGYPDDKAKIVDYHAKWTSNSFEYQNTARRFLEDQTEPKLAEAVRQAVENCWRTFGLRGWARVDMRIDANGQPQVIDVNANPDLSDDAGMAAAAAQAGLSYHQMIGRIVEAAFRHHEARQ